MKAVVVLAVYFLFCPVLVSAFSEQARQLIGHGGPINAIAINDQGSRAISGSLDYSVILWDLTTEQPTIVTRFHAHRGAVAEVRFLPGQARAVSAGDDGIIYLWDTQNLELLHRFSGHDAKVVSIDFTADGSRMASASWDGSLRVWDMRTLEPVRAIQVHRQTLHTALLSADGGTAYSAGHDGHIREWNLATGQMERVLHNHGWPVNLMRWLPGREKIVFGAANGDVQVLGLADGTIDKILIPHSKPVLGLAVSEKLGLLASGGNDGAIRVWKIANWSIAGETHGIPGPVWALAFNRDNSGLYFGSLDDNAGYWKISAEDDSQWTTNHRQRRFQVKSGLPPGELQFARKCSVCHDLTPGRSNRAGPSLYRLHGRKAGSLPGYPYSAALKQSPLVWNRDNIERLFSQGPDIVTPGSKMPLQRIPDEQNRNALIDYLITR